MVCTVCHKPVEPGFAHCGSRTCTWCMSCYRRKLEEAGITKPPAMP